MAAPRFHCAQGNAFQSARLIAPNPPRAHRARRACRRDTATMPRGSPSPRITLQDVQPMLAKRSMALPRTGVWHYELKLK
ncbi:hypothetical protein [Cupriavidus pinatubonensis]|uniref:Uncharacterized protein n=1 Tax=Cupriavidus pinatubonensis TaxID=248026 RepID=A0ABN7Y8N3_9BURK|nr:hypothetical protein [Cupriavidus pinatubonensis]CAG9169743.1 hypothetical protein LMG23994_01641 [Cupriavidus pinatubonensis]